MVNVELVIKVPEDLYEAYKDKPPMLGDAGMDMIAQAISKGKLLPKGHGRIIDESQITQVYMQTANEEKYINGIRIPPTIYIVGANAPTIVEAYKAESEEGQS